MDLVKETILGNLTRINQWMQANGVDLVFLCDPPNVRYTTGVGPFITRTMFESSYSEYVLLTKDNEMPTILVNSFYEPYYRDKVGWASDIGTLNEIETRLRKLSGIKRVITSTETPFHLIEIMRANLRDAVIVSDASEIERIRSIKSDKEIALVRKSAKISCAMMEKARKACKAGAKECEVAAEAEREMRRLGADTFAFSTIVSSGANLGVMQEIASEKKIRKGESVMVDLGATKNCYNTEFTRTFAVGRVRKEIGEFYRLVHQALEECIDVARPGETGHNVDKAARDVIRKAGHDFLHETGHGIGTAVWEYPKIAMDSKAELEANMIIAVEPAIYKPKVGGVRLEQNLLITKNKAQILTPFPFEEDLL